MNRLSFDTLKTLLPDYIISKNFSKFSKKGASDPINI